MSRYDMICWTARSVYVLLKYLHCLKTILIILGEMTLSKAYLWMKRYLQKFWYDINLTDWLLTIVLNFQSVYFSCSFEVGIYFGTFIGIRGDSMLLITFLLKMSHWNQFFYKECWRMALWNSEDHFKWPILKILIWMTYPVHIKYKHFQ